MANVEFSLACEIISMHFGECPSQVVRVLLERGPCQLHEILQVTKLEFWRVRNSLLSLIHHHAVTVSQQHPTQPPGGAAAPAKDAASSVSSSATASQSAASPPPSLPPVEGIVRYTAELREILLRLRYPKFVYFAEKARGRIARIILCQMAKLGRATLEEVTKYALEDPFNSVEGEIAEFCDEDDEPEALTASKIQWEFVEMMTDNYFERVAKFESNSATVDPYAGESEWGMTRHKRKAPKAEAKAKKKKKKNDVDELPDDLGMFIHSGSSNSSSAPRNHIANAKKRKAEEEREKKERAQHLIDEFTRDRVVFRLNTQHLSLEVCKEYAERFIRARWAGNEMIGRIAKALLSSARQLSTGIECRATPISEIEDALKKATGRESMDRLHLTNFLEGLTRHPDKMVRMQEKDGHAGYAIDWSQLRAMARRRQVYNVIKAQAGVEACRVWNLLTSNEKQEANANPLLDYRFWEDGQVAEAALLSPQVAREKLYQLARRGYIRTHQADLVSGAPASTSNKHLLIFGATVERSLVQVLRETYAIGLRLLQRKQDESSAVIRLYLRVQTLTVDEVEQLHARENGEDVLEYHILALDEALLVLRDV